MIKSTIIKLSIFLFSLFNFVTGAIDIDWMVVSPRFNDWYFTVDYWEFAPYFKMPWHQAYVFTVLRLVIGTLIIGAFLGYYLEKINLHEYK